MVRGKFATLLTFAIALVLAGSAGWDALAQSSKKGKEKPQGFFSRLFGPREPDTGRNPFLSTPNQRDILFFQRTRPPRNLVGPPADVVVVAPKNPKARKILVVGDFVAGGLAWGLDQELANEPKLLVIDRSNTNSGLVRREFYDWNAKLPELLNSEKPDIVVVVLGANDRQQMRVGNQRLAIRSAPWEEAYAERIEGLVDTLKVYGRPFFWVSAPPVRTGSVSADLSYLNGLFKARVEAAGGNFVDIWNGFADANGEYISAGPDIAGQVRSLRTGDGINFTRAGRLKLGFYLGRDLRRKTGVGSGVVELLPSVSQESQIEVGPDGRKLLVGPVISLTDPVPVANAMLAGPPGPAVYDPLTGTERPPVERAGAPKGPDVTSGESLRFKMIVKGESLPVVAGRVDDFAWPPAPAGPSPISAGLSWRPAAN